MVAVHPTPDTEQPAPDTEQLLWWQDASIAVRATDLLGELGVFDALATAARTVGELAASTGLAARPLDLALDVIAHHTGIVALGSDHRWRLVDPVARDMTISEHALRRLLCDGEAHADMSRTEGAAETYGALVERIGRVGAAVVDDVLPALVPAGPVVLELGAGSSPWGRALCQADPDVRVTVVDLAPVLDTARAIVAEAGLADRYEFVAGDVFAIDDPAPADLVVVAGLCRLFGAERNAELFARAARWCRTGGRIAVIDAVATLPARQAGLSGYELGLLTRTTTGRCWTLDHYARWLTAAGFAGIETTATTRPEVTLVTARRTDPT